MVSSLGERRATSGSARLDIRAAARMVLTPEMGIQAGLLLGRSSTYLKGLIVHPAVIDSDYEGEIKILVSSPRGVTAISPGDQIAQLLILPSLMKPFPVKEKKRYERFGVYGS
ncbi:deoxyuridine 5'-triphosphate nucleotidohydrolase-like [Mustela nigripes]|uniref:deoxyuridine 5'-triphosphate nucleotidohydrolase-like n=1 Tax=Mustela nigripes TaxID=77151 RepID=UPI002814CED5|nr:deoxyuridine 5'-triphosphate nucleotidohydrolase-like [Mustela nigripes]